MKMMLIGAVLITFPAIVVIGYGLVSNSYSIWPALISLFNGAAIFVLAAIWLRYNRKQGQDHGIDEH